MNECLFNLTGPKETSLVNCFRQQIHVFRVAGRDMARHNLSTERLYACAESRSRTLSVAQHDRMLCAMCCKVAVVLGTARGSGLWVHGSTLHPEHLFAVCPPSGPALAAGCAWHVALLHAVGHLGYDGQLSVPSPLLWILDHAAICLYGQGLALAVLASPRRGR